MSESAFRKYECIVCGFIYDEAEGVPDEGFRRAPAGKTSRMTGCAPTAASARKISTSSRDEPVVDCSATVFCVDSCQT